MTDNSYVNSMKVNHVLNIHLLNDENSIIRSLLFQYHKRQLMFKYTLKCDFFMGAIIAHTIIQFFLTQLCLKKCMNGLA